MTKSSFHKLLLGSVLMLLPFTVQAQVVLKNWTIEDHSGKVKILVSSDTLEITAPDGLTLWYNQRLTGDYENRLSCEDADARRKIRPPQRPELLLGRQ